MDTRRDTIKEYAAGLRKIGKKDVGDWYEEQLSLVEEARVELLGG